MFEEEEENIWSEPRFGDGTFRFIIEVIIEIITYILYALYWTWVHLCRSPHYIAALCIDLFNWTIYILANYRLVSYIIYRFLKYFCHKMFFFFLRFLHLFFSVYSVSKRLLNFFFQAILLIFFMFLKFFPHFCYWIFFFFFIFQRSGFVDIFSIMRDSYELFLIFFFFDLFCIQFKIIWDYYTVYKLRYAIVYSFLFYFKIFKIIYNWLFLYYKLFAKIYNHMLIQAEVEERTGTFRHFIYASFIFGLLFFLKQWTVLFCVISIWIFEFVVYLAEDIEGDYVEQCFSQYLCLFALVAMFHPRYYPISNPIFIFVFFYWSIKWTLSQIRHAWRWYVYMIAPGPGKEDYDTWEYDFTFLQQTWYADLTIEEYEKAEHDLSTLRLWQRDLIRVDIVKDREILDYIMDNYDITGDGLAMPEHLKHKDIRDPNYVPIELTPEEKEAALSKRKLLRDIAMGRKSQQNF